MKIGVTLGLVISATIVIGSAFARDEISDRERQALNNTQHEMTTCAAFYGLMKQCIVHRARPSEDGKIIQNADAAIERLVNDAREIGSSLGTTEDAMYSRMVNDMTTMKDLVKNDCINISSLLRRYANRCEQVVENPDSILAST